MCVCVYMCVCMCVCASVLDTDQNRKLLLVKFIANMIFLSFRSLSILLDLIGQKLAYVCTYECVFVCTVCV